MPATGSSFQDHHGRVVTAPVLAHHDAGGNVDDGTRAHFFLQVSRCVGEVCDVYCHPQGS
jgi:hypothetical protein